MGLCGNFADISFWDWRQYETIAYIISLSWIRFISIKHKSKWMHFELSIHWRSRVLSRSIYLAKNYAGHSWSDEWGTFLDEKFAFRVLRNRSLPFVISGGSRPWAKEAGGGGGGFFVACLAGSLPQDPSMIIVLLLTLFGNHLLSLTFAGVQKRRWRFGESWETARMYSASKEPNGRT